MPTRCIHSRSLRIPSLVILPFIQCHHTRGCAALGGVRKFLYKLSLEMPVCVMAAIDNSESVKRRDIFFIGQILKVKNKRSAFNHCPELLCKTLKVYFKV